MKNTFTFLLLASLSLSGPAAAQAAGGDTGPLFSESFDTSSSLARFTVLNNNGDSKTWAWDSSTQAVVYEHSAWKDADDYLVLPGLELEAGKLYTFSFDTYRQSSFKNEKIAAYVGTAPTVAAMTTELLAPVNVEAQKIENQKETKSLDFTPAVSGTYYFAIKACSPYGTLKLYADNVMVTAPKTATAPDAPGNFTVTPAPFGELKVTISFTVPTLNIDGAPLEELDRVEIFRGDALAATVKVEPGHAEAYTVTDENAVYGENVYRAVAVNSGGAGREARATVFVGNDLPAAPGEVTMVHGDGDGDVTVRWTAPAADVRGLSIDPATLSYTLKKTRPSQEWYLDLTDGVKGLSYSYQECDPDAEQAFYKYSVRASNDIGAGDAAFSTMWIPLGRPDVAPYCESFAGGLMDHIYRTKLEQGTGLWGVARDDTMEDITAYDDDNGYILCAAGDAGDVGALYSGRIDLAGVENPALTFHYFSFGSDDTSSIEVLVNPGQGFEPVATVEVAAAPADTEWNQCIIPLDAYRGQKVEFCFRATVSNYKTAAIDAITVYDRAAHDLGVILDAPSSVISGEQAQVRADVDNRGAMASGSYSVSFYVNGELSATQAGEPLAAGETERFFFDLPSTLFDTATAECRAEVEYDADADLSNNVSATQPVMFLQPVAPAPVNLAAAAEGASVVLTWDAPAAKPAKAKTDDFESYEPFATGSAGDWTFVDVDQAIVDGPTDFDIPNVPAGEKASFFVMDTSGEDFVTYSFTSHSGDKCLAAVFNAYHNPNDDWAVSPELSGDAQIITLWARSYSSKWPDSFEVLYSTTDAAPASFTSAVVYNEIPAAWKEYKARIPEGARYFAVRYMSTDAFILMVDDITFAAKDAAPDNSYAVTGYNIYRDRVKLNDSPVAATSFTDADVPAGSHVYNVAALYGVKGQSAPSADVAVDTSSIDAVGADTQGAVIAAVPGGVAVSCAAGMPVAVYGVDGRLVERRQGSGSEVISLHPGIYIVAVGTTTAKVAVR